jgi:hypothetical protein
LAQRLIVERGLADRCEARAQSVDQLGEEEAYDVATSFLVLHEIAPALKPAAFASSCAGVEAWRLLPNLR